jgi:signal transduction histidine kinase
VQPGTRPRRWRPFVLPLLLLLLAAGPAAASGPDRVLFLHSYGRHFAPFDAYGRTLRAELVRRSPQPLDIEEASIDIAGGGGEAAILAYLEALFADAAPALIVGVGGSAAAFAQAHRAELFPGTPLLLAGVEERRIDRATLAPGDRVAAYRMDPLAAAETILAVMPEVRQLLVVLGSSPLELYWREQAEQDLKPLEGRVSLDWTTGLPFEEILRRVAGLPPDAAVFYGLLLVDGEGIPLEEDRALVALSEASAAPVFGLFESQLGHGIVGARLLPVDATARAAAAVAVAMLAGEAGEVPITEGSLVFDSRQLARFGISERRLPPGSVVRFREPSAWERYRRQILLVAAILLVQSTLIAVLVASRHRLQLSRSALVASQERAREAAAAARTFAGRLIHAQEEERSRLGRELHDDITQRLAALAIEAGQRERQASNLEDAGALARMRQGLALLGKDVHALSYRLHPSIVVHLGLAAALESEAERIAEVDGLPVAVDARDLPDDLPAPLALCLFRVAQESLRNAVRHAHASRARVSVAREGRHIRLAVEDDGIGFAAETEGRRMSLGLSSMAERVAAVGGVFGIDSAPGRGTRIDVRIPLEE